MAPAPLRAASALAAIRGGLTPTSRVRIATLSHTQRELLRQAFGQIAAVQSRIGYEFPEGG
jgi:hypothetical protein